MRDLQKIQSAGKHLLGLINSILDLSKIEAGRMDVYLEQVNLTAADRGGARHHPAADRKERQPADRSTARRDIGSMRTDLTKVKQSLINLLSNAAKFTEKGEIGLIRRAAAVGRRARRTSCSRSSDSGIGMTDEQMGRLFEAFAQANSSTTRNFGGTGLGLAITSASPPCSAARSAVTSKPGVGSTFTLDVARPVGRGMSATAGPIAETDDDAPTATALTVLVVDDDPAVHDVLTPTLTKKGYRVMHARDGAEALSIVRKTPPDVVTLDVMMPNVDGWSVLGAMKSDPALAHIPVIMLTIVDDRNLGWSLGASEYMTKPIDRERLVALVRRFTNRNANAVVLIVDDDAEVRNVVSSDAAQRRPENRRGGQRPGGVRLARRQSAARPRAARPDDAGDGRLPVPRAAARASGMADRAGRRADREGPDRGGEGLSSRNGPFWCWANRRSRSPASARRCRRSPRGGGTSTKSGARA